MNRLVSFLLVCVCCFMLVACDNSSEHIGEAKTPSASSVLKGQNYENVVKTFEDKGFTNIKLEKIEDLITGWLTEDGEVEEVSVGGNVDYSPDQWVANDIEVIIKYHTFPEDKKETEKTGETEPIENIEEDNSEDTQKNILTVENCAELSSILSNKAENDPSYTAFSQKYKGRTIEFDGRIDYLVNHEDYDTRYDILVSAGDYNPNHQIGPTFKFEDVGVYDLDLDTLYLEDEIKVGMNVHIVAEVEKFDTNSYLFFLDPISVSKR